MGALTGVIMQSVQRWLNRSFQGLWRSPDFRRLWTSLTITAFGAQITNLALPLTAALLLQATPFQMGVLVALETLPFALVSLHAGVLLDRVRKLPIVIAADIGRGVALLAIPAAAFTHVLSIEILYVVGFFCGVQNVVGGAAYQVLLAQMAGRKRLVEANAKITLGETSSALVGPGIAGLLIQALSAPFAIVLDAATFFVSALMLRRVEARNDVVHRAERRSVSAAGWQAFGLVSGPPWAATLALGIAMLVFDFGAVLYGINYLALRQAITPDRLLGRMTATMRFCTVAAAPLGSLIGGTLATGIGLRPTLLVVGALGLALAIGAMMTSPFRSHRTLPAAAAE